MDPHGMLPLRIPLGPPLAAEEVPWTEIPAVRVIGLVIGAVLLFAAIRAMFRR